jgi:hypothetical protein
MGWSSGGVSDATSITGGWYALIMDTGLDEERSVRVLRGVGESRAEDATCAETDEGCSGCWTGALLTGVEEVGDRGGPPKADMNERTTMGTQGVSKGDS